MKTFDYQHHLPIQNINALIEILTNFVCHHRQNNCYL